MKLSSGGEPGVLKQYRKLLYTINLLQLRDSHTLSTAYPEHHADIPRLRMYITAHMHNSTFLRLSPVARGNFRICHKDLS
jgi:hypothetical protein